MYISEISQRDTRPTSGDPHQTDSCSKERSLQKPNERRMIILGHSADFDFWMISCPWK